MESMCCNGQCYRSDEELRSGKEDTANVDTNSRIPAAALSPSNEHPPAFRSKILFGRASVYIIAAGFWCKAICLLGHRFSLLITEVGTGGMVRICIAFLLTFLKGNILEASSRVRFTRQSHKSRNNLLLHYIAWTGWCSNHSGMMRCLSIYLSTARRYTTVVARVLLQYPFQGGVPSDV